jgi:hypothetical protein
MVGIILITSFLPNKSELESYDSPNSKPTNRTFFLTGLLGSDSEKFFTTLIQLVTQHATKHARALV